jgi:lipoprotein-anchoring transpeptidase ErfK/SrfK
MATRRYFTIGAIALAVSAVSAQADDSLYGGSVIDRDLKLAPPPESAIDFPITSYAASLPEKFRRQQVTFGSSEPTGSIIVDPEHRYLYFILGEDQAIRYGVGVGREGFAWSGRANIGMKRRWPRWLPPEEMVLRDVHAAAWTNGMPGGPENPLGARAMYLVANGIDTLFRIHGTNDPKSIGKAMSSGCIRMLNEDVADLFERTKLGAPVLVVGPGAL